MHTIAKAHESEEVVAVVVRHLVDLYGVALGRWVAPPKTVLNFQCLKSHFGAKNVYLTCDPLGRTKKPYFPIENQFFTRSRMKYRSFWIGVLGHKEHMDNWYESTGSLQRAVRKYYIGRILVITGTYTQKQRE